ncbi:unnamed protein product, partial [Hapterophycus canaliculatus]
MTSLLKNKYDGVDIGEGGLGFPKRITATEVGRVWFARGWMHACNFNHEEALRCFEACIEADTECAMAHWGIGEC